MRNKRTKMTKDRRNQIVEEGLRRVSLVNVGRDRLLAGLPIAIGGKSGGVRIVQPGTPEAEAIIRRG